MTPDDGLLAECSLSALGLLRDEYPDEMAAAACSCAPPSVCPAHRMLVRYEGLFAAFHKANAAKREQRARAAAAEAALRDERALADRLREALLRELDGFEDEEIGAQTHEALGAWRAQRESET